MIGMGQLSPPSPPPIFKRCASMCWSAPATSADSPDSSSVCRSLLPAPTPSMMLDTLTSPSLAPSTAARSQGARSE